METAGRNGSPSRTPSGATETELRKLEKIIEYEVTEAYYRFLDQQNTVATSELQLIYNRTNWEALTAKYRLWLASIKEVLDAQVLLGQAEQTLNRAKPICSWPTSICSRSPASCGKLLSSEGGKKPGPLGIRVWAFPS